MKNLFEIKPDGAGAQAAGEALHYIIELTKPGYPRNLELEGTSGNVRAWGQGVDYWSPAPGVIVYSATNDGPLSPVGVLVPLGAGAGAALGTLVKIAPELLLF